VQRHPRFQDFFEHSHSFVEINYVYSGACRNIVNGNCISMQEGDFLVMAPGCRHKIEPLGENDLLINFLFLPIYAEVILDKVIPGKSRIAEFLVSSMYSAASKSNYVFFETHGNDDLSNIADDIMREYFDQDPETSEALIECLMHELFILLWRHNIRHPEKVTYAFQPNSTIAMIVNYIKENSVTCTRESTAKHFAYSPNHLSNLLIENIGKGFVQLRNEFRLDLAKRKLFSTGQSVRSIADECGFTNITQFYKLYKDTFGKLPREESQ
jgi:AraC-like DNA-binding protein